MMTPRALTIGRSPTSRVVRRFPWLLVLLIGAGAGPFRPTPKFEGRLIPNPPRQGEPWTPPETMLPGFLVRATDDLFASGMADPRDCEYREVEIGDAGLVTTRGFVLPERPGLDGRFAVSWDGVVYPVFALGPAADVEVDVRAMADAMVKGRQADEAAGRTWPGGASGFVNPGGSPGPFLDEGGSPTAFRSPRTLGILLRLGRADLAERLFAAGTVWTPEAPRPDLTDYHLSFVSLANGWGGVVYHRLLSAHQRGDDVVALDAARRLAAFQQAVDARAEAMGFLRPGPRYDGPVPAPYLGPYSQLDILLADQERRAQEPPRGPIPTRGADRIAALIRAFDQIHVRQFSVPGSANPADAPIVHELIAEGDAAVAPLLEALVSDTRLTRSVTGGRGPEHVHPVTDAIYGALRGILKTDRFLEHGDDQAALRTPEGRQRLAAAIRTFWEKNREIPLVERWSRTLRDDSAGSRRWLEAAAGLTQPSEADRPLVVIGAVLPRRPGPAPSMKGEPLRSRHDPSVSDLLARRSAEPARSSAGTNSDSGLNQACSLALMFVRWDEPASLPTVKALMTACRERSEDRSDRSYGPFLARFTEIRVGAGDREALEEYADWVEDVQPKAIVHSLFAALAPLWTYPDHPAIAEAARSMFRDPNSPWLPLVPRERNQLVFPFEDPIASPLVCLPPFREALLAALEDETPVGTASLGTEGAVRYQLKSGLSGSIGNLRTPNPGEHPRVEVTIRACDVIAWKLSVLEGAPECPLYGDEAHRDAAVAACAEYLRHYGSHFSPEAPPGENDFPHPKAHLRFPSLGRPATAEDVREGRAIFSLEDEGEARVVALPGGFPRRARWVTLQDFPIDRQLGNGQIRRDYLQDGWIWQAEEVRKDEGWERFYGFVGHATIARVPAAEIEFPGSVGKKPIAGESRLKPSDDPPSPRHGP